jgi:O-antigen ligase
VRSLTSFFFLATVFCCTFEKIHWNVAGAVGIADVFAILFLISFLIVSRPRLPVTSAIVLVFFAAFLVVYLAGYFNLETHQALAQFAKGFVKFVIHFSFLAAGVAWLARRGRAYFWRTLAWFVGGMAANAAYGVLQLLAARSGYNLDAALLSPLTGGASQINIYGAVEGAKVYRPNAITGDPNHLGIMLVVPLLVLAPLYLRLERGHRLKLRLGLLIGFLLLVEIATLSRSGLLGLLVGTLILLIPYRRYVLTKALLYPLAGALAVLGVVVITRLHFFEVVFRSRIQTGKSESAHFQVYDFVPQILHSHPLLGLGLNTFSIYYEFATGKTNWGPHSFYVALIVETGLVGTILFATFLYWVFQRLRRARAIGRALTAAGDPLAARVRPLAWGFTAALAGTLAANAFYLTMQFYYFYAFLALALALPIVFATAQSESPTGSGTRSSTRSAGTSRS